MKDSGVVTLPIVNAKNKLEGLIVTGDIATSYMDVYDNRVLATARTQYRNIVETMDGELLTGNEHGYFVKGKVVVASGDDEVMKEYIEEDDLVILANRPESQRCALELNASCIVVCTGTEVSEDMNDEVRGGLYVGMEKPSSTRSNSCSGVIPWSSSTVTELISDRLCSSFEIVSSSAKGIS